MTIVVGVVVFGVGVADVLLVVMVVCGVLVFSFEVHPIKRDMTMRMRTIKGKSFIDRKFSQE